MESRTPGSPRGPNFRLAGFPKEFERNFWETIDKRYYSILAVTFLLLYGFAFYMAFQDWSLSEEQLNRLKRYAIQKVYDVSIVEETDLAEEDMIGVPTETVPREEEPSKEVSEKGKERVEESQTERQQRRRSTQADARARSRQLQKEVANEGILAIATAAGGGGSGNLAYYDVLADMDGSGGIGDMGEVVRSTSGIRAANSRGDRTRAAKGSGIRADGEGTGIDDMIAETDVGSGGSFERRGEVSLSAENVQFQSGSGTRDSDGITAAINNQKSSIEYCYQKSAKVNPNLSGRIDLELVIAPDGRVTRVIILSSNLNDPKLDACIKRAASRWRFGEADGGEVKIRVPFIF